MAAQTHTDREVALLKALMRHISAYEGSLPDTQWLARQLQVTPQRVSNLKHSLKQKGYLDPEMKAAMPTKKAIQLLSSLQVVFPTHIRVLGQVKAGRTRQDEVVVELRDANFLDDTDVPTITVPHKGDTSGVFALRVVGQSMEHENIFDGDYVIVQRWKDAEKPRQGELVVVQYLPICDEQYVDIEHITSQSGVPDEYLEGPTVKYLYEKEGFYRLGWRKDFDESSHTIKTRYVKPIGRVIGVYRVI